MSALSFLDHINKIEQANRLIDDFAGKIKSYGFDRFTYVGLRLPRVPGPQPIVSTTFPPEWYNRYSNEGYAAIDPIIREASRNVLPFQWDVNELAKSGTEPERKMLGEAGEFGVVQGLTVPVCGHFGEFAWISIASDQNSADVRQAIHQHRNDLHLLSIYYHVQVADSLADPTIEPKRILLSPREVEVLLWAAQGKSSQDIADILLLTHRTVLHTIVGIRQKFGVRTIQQAIVQSILLGLIQP